MRNVNEISKESVGLKPWIQPSVLPNKGRKNVGPNSGTSPIDLPRAEYTGDVFLDDTSLEAQAKKIVSEGPTPRKSRRALSSDPRAKPSRKVKPRSRRAVERKSRAVPSTDRRATRSREVKPTSRRASEPKPRRIQELRARRAQAARLRRAQELRSQRRAVLRAKRRETPKMEPTRQRLDVQKPKAKAKAKQRPILSNGNERHQGVKSGGPGKFSSSGTQCISSGCTYTERDYDHSEARELELRKKSLKVLKEGDGQLTKAIFKAGTGIIKAVFTEKKVSAVIDAGKTGWRLKQWSDQGEKATEIWQKAEKERAEREAKAEGKKVLRREEKEAQRIEAQIAAIEEREAAREAARVEKAEAKIAAQEAKEAAQEEKEEARQAAREDMEE